MKLTEQMRVQGQNSRARVLGTSATLTLKEWEQTIADFNGMCAYCMLRPFVALERFIPVSIEGTHVRNCLPACRKCNNLKKGYGVEYAIKKFGRETIERLQEYLANRINQTEPTPRKPRRPRPTLPEEVKRIKIYGGINGQKPQSGDEIELQGANGIIRRKVDWVACTYINYNLPDDYDVYLLEYEPPQ